MRQRICALVVGIGDYVHSAKLPNAVNDALAIKRLLEAAGVKVFYIENCYKHEFESIAKEFRDSIRENDGVIFFFAGHGVEFNNVNRLMTLSKSNSGEPSYTQDAINLLSLLFRLVTQVVARAVLTLLMIHHVNMQN